MKLVEYILLLPSILVFLIFGMVSLSLQYSAVLAILIIFSVPALILFIIVKLSLRGDVYNFVIKNSDQLNMKLWDIEEEIKQGEPID